VANLLEPSVVNFIEASVANLLEPSVVNFIEASVAGGRGGLMGKKR
jgi:hypothetical protein